MINFEWKPVSEIPTKHWEKNPAISPFYLVKCEGTFAGHPIIGYTNYSFATNKWMDCFHATEPGIHDVIAWTDVDLIESESTTVDEDYAKEVIVWEDAHPEWDREIVRKTAKHFTDWQKEHNN